MSKSDIKVNNNLGGNVNVVPVEYRLELNATDLRMLAVVLDSFDRSSGVKILNCTLSYETLDGNDVLFSVEYNATGNHVLVLEES